jgi:soluble lytic murein transglycosylase
MVMQPCSAATFRGKLATIITAVKNLRIAFGLLLCLVSLGFVLTAQASTAHKRSASANRKAATSRKAAGTHAKAEGTRKAGKTRSGTKAAKGKKSKALTAKERAQRAANARRVGRLTRAFVASANLKPMARQLLEARTPAAYAGVESYARRHPSSDAGSLAWLAVGYGRILDKDQGKAIEPLKRALLHAGDLGDYVTYYLANSYAALGRSSDVATTLADFETKYPDSLLMRDAMRIYASALLASGRTSEAQQLLEKYRNPVRSDYELAIGRVYARTGEYAKAAEIFKRVYCGLPLSSEADDAKAELDKLVAQGAAQPATFAERKSRADLLATARRSSDAAREYRALLQETSPSDRNAISAALGVALHRSGNDREARGILESLPDSADESNAQRLLALAEMARSAEDESTLIARIGQMRQTNSRSDQLEQALLLAGNMYLLRKDYDKAIDYYREMQQRFPAGKRASYAHWKAAWLTLRQGRVEEAKKEFEEEVALYPTSPEAPASFYWRARLAEEEHETAKARAWYQTVATRFQSYYYAELARARLKALPAQAVLRDVVLEKLPPVAPAPSGDALVAPTDNIHAQKALLLANGGLTDLAVKELRATSAEGNQTWAGMQIARIYKEFGRDDRALETLKRAVPGYYALGVEGLPRPYWEVLFPRPFWSDLKRYSVQNQLDPYLVASLIRQESEFNPGALSHANAWGLMQLLPVTGERVARELRVRNFSTQKLLAPEVNLQLGTRYFRTMIDQFDGRIEYALAAYNAGDHRVRAWLADGTYRDVDEFVESIPFTETREYVQAIVRNAAMYKRLYGTP